MPQTIEVIATVDADHQVRIRDERMTPGERVTVVVAPLSETTDRVSARHQGSIWDVVARAGGTASSEEIVERVRRERDAWGDE